MLLHHTARFGGNSIVGNRAGLSSRRLFIDRLVGKVVHGCPPLCLVAILSLIFVGNVLGQTTGESERPKNTELGTVAFYGRYISLPVEEALQALADIDGGPEIQQVLRAIALRKQEALPAIKARLYTGNIWDKKAMTRLLRCSPTPEAYPDLLALALRKDEHWLTRMGALYALGELGDVSAGRSVMGILSEPNCPAGVQLAAISTLARIGYREAAIAIREFEQHEDIHLRLFASRALAEFGEPVERQYVISALENQDYVVRKEACEALATVEGEDIAERLATAAQTDYNEAVRIAARIALLCRETRIQTASQKLTTFQNALDKADRRTASWILWRILRECGPEGRSFIETLGSQDTVGGERARTFLTLSGQPFSSPLPVENTLIDAQDGNGPMHADVPTHQTLMEYAISKAASLETPLSFTSSQQTRMREGARDEDMWDPSPRFINHGYNPLTNSGFVTDYGIGATARDTAFTRWNSMTSSFIDGRLDGGDGDGAWHYLGRVSHLLQDMSSPLHALGTYWHALGCQFEEFWGNNDSLLRSTLNSIGGPLHSSDALPSEAAAKQDPFTQARLQYRYDNSCPNKASDDIRGWIEVLAWITYFRATYWGEVSFGTTGSSGLATSSQTTGTTFTDGYVGAKMNALHSMFDGNIQWIAGWTDYYYEITDRYGYIFRWMSYTDIDDWSSCGRNWANGCQESSIRVGGGDDDVRGVRITGRFWFDTCELGKDTSGTANRRCYPNRYPNGDSMTDDLHLYYGKYGYPLTVRYNAGLLDLANRPVIVSTSAGQANGFTWSRKDNYGNGPAFNADTAGTNYYFASKSSVELTAPSDDTSGHPFMAWLKDGVSFSTSRAITINTSSTPLPRNGSAYTAVYNASNNNPPATPSLVSPTNGASGIGITPTLQASTFSDPDGDTHANSQWQVDSNSDFSDPEWDSGMSYAADTQATVPSGPLSYNTTYYWRVRYKDNRGAWSSWAPSRYLRTQQDPGTTSPSFQQCGVQVIGTSDGDVVLESGEDADFMISVRNTGDAPAINARGTIRQVQLGGQNLFTDATAFYPDIPVGSCKAQTDNCDTAEIPKSFAGWIDCVMDIAYGINCEFSRPMTFRLQVTPAPYMTVAPPERASFGVMTPGDAASVPVTIQSIGSDALTVSAVNCSNPCFSVAGITLPAVIPAGTSVTFSVNVDTMSCVGAVTGNVTVVGNDNLEPSRTFTIEGTVSDIPQEIILTTSLPGGGFSPDLDGTTIAFLNSQTGTEVYTLDLCSGVMTQCTNSGGAKLSCRISGDHAVYALGELNNRELYLLTLSTGVATRITNNSLADESPDITGDYIIWRQYDRDATLIVAEILQYRISTGVTANLTNTSSINELAPEVWGDYAVWQDSAQGKSIWLYHLSLGTKNAIRTARVFGGARPRIGPAGVLWIEEVVYPTEYESEEVFRYALASGPTVQETSTETRSEDYPVSGTNHIAYMDWTTKNVYVKDLATGVESIASTNLSMKQDFRMEGEVLCWGSDDGHIHAVFLNPADVAVLSENITLDTVPAVAGQPNTLRCVVQNLGRANLTNVLVRFYLGDPALGGTPIGSPQTIASLTAGDFANVAQGHTFLAGGSARICVTVTFSGCVLETNHANNQACQQFTVINVPPSRPTPMSPPDGALNLSLTPVFQASPFSDPDAGSHEASHWQIDDDSDFESLAWDSGEMSPSTSINVPPGAITYSIMYYWRVRYKDGQGLWSEWSDAWSFRTTNPPLAPGDFDRDGDVDNADHDSFEACASGPGIAYAAGCEAKDLDPDGDVDQVDLGMFQRCLSGENVPADPHCADLPPIVSSFTINDGSASTTMAEVTLNNTCEGNATHYIASESSDFSGASWQAYSTSPSFSLSAGGGTKTVYFKVKNASGESSVVSDTITLNQSGPGQPLTLDLGGGVTMELILIPADSFQMGDLSGIGESDEHPVHPVTISQPFYIGKYEVTQAQWQAVMENNPSLFTGNDNMPVQEVSPDDCRTFCERLSAPGLTVRMPTEAEWEYACRGGTNTDYYWGNSAADAGQYAWHSGNSGGTPHEVGLKLPNSLGIFDMAGNVKEWCNDWYSSTYYSVSPVEDPTGPASGPGTCLRGGAWFYDPGPCRSANRDLGDGASNLGIVGFRVVAVP